MLGTNCQNSNKYTGDTRLNGCPAIGQSGYNEVDNAEFYAGQSGWGRFYVANPNFSGGTYATVPVDGNYHVFGTVWTAASMAQYMDNQLEYSTTQSPNINMFLIMQIQAGGVGGTPVNSLLPAYLNVDYVKVCNANYNLSQCENAAPTDPNVIFWDGFGGPAL
jgi:beta-glucanase (GH16 family)